MTVDIRTRTDRPVEAIDPAEFLDEALPELFAIAAERLAESVTFLSPRPLAIDVGGAAWTLSVSGDAVHIRRGRAGGAGVLHLDAEQLGYFVDDQATPMTWLTAGTLRLGGGARLEELLDWWLLLRSAIDGSTPHVPGALDLAVGDAPDLDHVFAPDDPAADMASFLERYGFLHIGGLFTEPEMAAVSADMDLAAPRYTQGDGRSWWATLSDGSDALVRMQGFDLESPAVAALVDDERLQRIGGLTGDGHEWGQRTDNKIEALFKPLGVVRGISDIPWHKDCSLGRHSYDCCALNVGISVTGGDAVSGQLRVVAGSHRANVWPAPTLQAGLDLPVVDLPTRTGDITVHLSCTLHMAQAPVERERRVMYSAFSLPAANQALADESRRRIREARELAPTNAPQAPVVDTPHLDRTPA